MLRSCVLLADRHRSLTEGSRELPETAFGTVAVVTDQASSLEGRPGLDPKRRSWICRWLGTADVAVRLATVVENLDMTLAELSRAKVRPEATGEE
jgi:hypothetical protein